MLSGDACECGACCQCASLDLLDVCLLEQPHKISLSAYDRHVKQSRQSRLILFLRTASDITFAGRMAQAMGSVSTMNFSIALYPVPRSSFLHYAFNTEFSSIIKYHRWFSFALVWLIIAHGSLYYAIWLAEGRYALSQQFGLFFLSAHV